jgi:hypothetical protein
MRKNQWHRHLTVVLFWLILILSIGLTSYESDIFPSVTPLKSYNAIYNFDPDVSILRQAFDDVGSTLWFRWHPHVSIALFF